MVRQWQSLYYGQRYSATVLDDQLDFVKLAEAMGAVGMRVTKKEEVAPALKKAITLGRPVVLELSLIHISSVQMQPVTSPESSFS